MLSLLHSEAYAMDHFLLLLFALCDGRWVSKTNCSNISHCAVYSQIYKYIQTACMLQFECLLLSTIFLWTLQIRGLRSKIGKNECLLCCVDFLFHLVEFLVRWFNKYAYVQVLVLPIQLQSPLSSSNKLLTKDFKSLRVYGLVICRSLHKH